MNSTEYYASCEQAISDFYPVLKDLFPEMVTASLGFNNALQAKSSLSVNVISPWKVTEHNADVRFIVMMHLTGSFGQVEDIEKFSLENLTIPRKFKYRKISGKTPYIVIAKFVKWLEKNQELIVNEIREAK